MQRVDPRVATPDMAGIIRMIMRITELGGSGATDLGDLYIRPPVDGFAMLDFSAFDRLVELGYATATSRSKSGSRPRTRRSSEDLRSGDRPTAGAGRAGGFC